MAAIYQDAGWTVYEFSSKVRSFDRKCGLMGEGTNVAALEAHIESTCTWSEDFEEELQDLVVVITDEPVEDRWNPLKTDGVRVFHVKNAMDVPLPGTIKNMCPSRGHIFTCTVGRGGGRCKFCHLYYSVNECAAKYLDPEVFARILQWHIDAEHTWGAHYVSDPRQDPSKYGFDKFFVKTRPEDLFGPIDIEHLARTGKTRPFTPSRPQEATMTYFNKPTVVTSVHLDRGRSDSSVTIADLKRLIAEVERVGGNDASAVVLSNDTRTWNVTLTVAMPEEPVEAEVTDEERLALLDEHKTAGTSRKKEIKGLLGL